MGRPPVGTAHWGCFLALRLGLPDEPAADYFGFPEPENAPVAWFPNAYLHVTLVFLGWLRSNEVNALEMLSRDGSWPVPASVEVTGEVALLGPDPSPTHLAALVSPRPDLLSCRLEVERAAESLGHGVAARDYRPHLSLGRVPPGTRPFDHVRIRRLELPVEGCYLLESRDESRVLLGPVVGRGSEVR